MPSEAAKKARMCEMKCFSLLVSFSQSLMSAARSISSAVQKDASAFLYMCHTSGCLIGKSTKRCLFSMSMGSSLSMCTSGRHGWR